MKSDSKPLLTAQAEKANHYTYLKEFRVEQCPLFIQRKCTQHRPFTCFNWHFMNQRRRRPVRKRDRTFNYSADNYCTKYDETTGICPDGDECPFLHRTAGDTERRYHLRYYKTCMCVHDTDTRGFCVKNGPHCAFAHGNHDLRPPVYDIKEIQALENADSDPNSTTNGPNILDKERNLMNEDPKWQDTNYVLSNYKTEPCKRPPRLCRQGYACPQYHNSKDKRRSPRKYKYRSTPCPNVKHGEEWGEPGNCEQGDACTYCHTRTEQQFHPEIYKSTKCNDVQQAGYCPRGVFCAFAHVDLLPTEELSLARDISVPLDCGTNLADILSSALPPDKRSTDKDKLQNDSCNGSGELSESASTSSQGSNSSHSKAPGAQLHNSSNNTGLSSSHKLNSMMYNASSLMQIGELRKQMMALESDPLLTKSEKAQRKQSLYLAYNINGSMGGSHSLGSTVSPLSGSSFYPNDTVESVVGNALDELHLDDPLSLVDSIHRDTNSPLSNSISAGLVSSGLLGSSAPVNIPGMAERSILSNFSPTTSSPLQNLQSAGFLTGSRFSHQDSIESTMPFMSHSISDQFSNHIPHLSSSASKISGFNSSLFDFTNQGLSPSRTQALPASPLINAFSSISPSNSNSLSELQVQRLREELTSSRAQLATWDERINQARVACAAWQSESEDAKRKAALAEQQRDDALMQVKQLRVENEAPNGDSYIHSLKRTGDLRNMSIAGLKSMQSQLRQDLEEIEKVLYRETATKCMVCEEQNRTVTLSPCNHFVVCGTCAPKQRDCPYCQTPVVSTS